MTNNIRSSENKSSTFQRIMNYFPTLMLRDQLKRQGFTYSETLDLGMTARYIHLDADGNSAARDKIILHKSELEKVFGLNIDTANLHVTPEMDMAKTA